MFDENLSLEALAENLEKVVNYYRHNGIGGPHWSVRSCGICDAVVGYSFMFPQPMYDSSCDCAYSAPQPRTWVDVAQSYRNVSPERKAYFHQVPFEVIDGQVADVAVVEPRLLDIDFTRQEVEKLQSGQVVVLYQVIEQALPTTTPFGHCVERPSDLVEFTFDSMRQEHPCPYAVEEVVHALYLNEQDEEQALSLKVTNLEVAQLAKGPWFWLIGLQLITSDSAAITA